MDHSTFMGVAGGLCAGSMLTEEDPESAPPAARLSLQGTLVVGCVAALSSVVVLAMSAL
jgi:hypothetical protein